MEEIKKKKIKKAIKIVLIVIISLILALVIAAVALFQFLVKPNAEKIIDAVNVILEDEEIMEEIRPYLTENEYEQLIENAGVLIEELPAEAVDIENENQTQNNEIDNTTNASENSQQPGIVETPKPKKDKSEYSSSYDYIKSNVEPNDFKVGVNFASRIDVGYVIGLLSGGLTKEEKVELKAYLKKKFTSEEIAMGIKLYSKYSYLLN